MKKYDRRDVQNLNCPKCGSSMADHRLVYNEKYEAKDKDYLGLNCEEHLLVLCKVCEHGTQYYPLDHKEETTNGI